jgi:hypothetical protein
MLLVALFTARSIPAKERARMTWSAIRRHYGGHFGAAEAPNTTNGSGASFSYEELGQTVAEILRSAHETAVQMIAAAREQAQSIRESAQVHASDAFAQLDAEIAEQRSEFASIRADADRYAEDRRRAADFEAGRIRSDAEKEAHELRQVGEANCRSFEAEGLARRGALMDASSSAETRLRQTLATCRDVAGEVDRILKHGKLELREDLEQTLDVLAEDLTASASSPNSGARTRASSREFRPPGRRSSVSP